MIFALTVSFPSVVLLLRSISSYDNNRVTFALMVAFPLVVP